MESDSLSDDPELGETEGWNTVGFAHSQSSTDPVPGEIGINASIWDQTGCQHVAQAIDTLVAVPRSVRSSGSKL
jgi:hypothetical protein